MTLLERIQQRHSLHGKNSIADLQTRYAWAHSDRADLLDMLTAETARADAANADLAIVTCGACGSETATSNHLSINKQLTAATARADAAEERLRKLAVFFDSGVYHDRLVELYHATNRLMVTLGAHGEIDTAGAICTRVLNALGSIDNEIHQSRERVMKPKQPVNVPDYIEAALEDGI
jgi:hypothetical protein